MFFCYFWSEHWSYLTGYANNPGKHSIYDTKLKTDVAIPKHRQAVYTARYTAEDICVTQKSYAGKLRETESR